MSFNKGSENRCQHGAKYMEVYLIEYLCVFFLCVAFFLFMGDDDYPHTHTNKTLFTEIIKHIPCKRPRWKRYVGGSLRAVLIMRCLLAMRASDRRAALSCVVRWRWTSRKIQILIYGQGRRRLIMFIFV